MKFNILIEEQNEEIEMKMIERLHFWVVNLKKNVEIVVLSGITQRIASQNSTAEITKNFRKIKVMALTALIII
jgi:hypothetical protein